MPKVSSTQERSVCDRIGVKGMFGRQKLAFFHFLVNLS